MILLGIGTHWRHNKEMQDSGTDVRSRELEVERLHAETKSKKIRNFAYCDLLVIKSIQAVGVIFGS